MEVWRQETDTRTRTHTHTHTHTHRVRYALWHAVRHHRLDAGQLLRRQRLAKHQRLERVELVVAQRAVLRVCVRVWMCVCVRFA